MFRYSKNHILFLFQQMQIIVLIAVSQEAAVFLRQLVWKNVYNRVVFIGVNTLYDVVCQYNIPLGQMLFDLFYTNY
jgi:hypothetical protein